MPQQTVIDNDFCTMWYYPDTKIVHHKIKKFIYGEVFYQFLMTGTELIKKNGAKKWLSDDRHSPILRKEDIEWGRVNWFPKTVLAGWKYWAIVQPHQPLGQSTMEDLVAMYSKGGITARFFTDIDEAMRWLESQPE